MLHRGVSQNTQFRSRRQGIDQPQRDLLLQERDIRLVVLTAEWQHSNRFHFIYRSPLRRPVHRFLRICQTAVSLPRYSFDVARAGCRISQRLPKCVNRFVQAVLEVYKGVRRPQLLADFFASASSRRVLQQERQNFARLRGQFDLQAKFSKLTDLRIEFKRSKPNGRRSFHGAASLIWLTLDWETLGGGRHACALLCAQVKKICRTVPPLMMRRQVSPRGAGYSWASADLNNCTFIKLHRDLTEIA